MARVNIDSIAFSDARFMVLATLMGSDDPDLALGRMCRLWNQCYERETYVLTQSVITALFRGNQDAAKWLIEAELAQPVEDEPGSFRICGTQGRIEYVARKRATARQNGTKGGRPPVTNIGTQKNQRGIQTETPPSPSPAPDTPPAPDLNTPHTPQRGAIGFEEFWEKYPRKTAKAKAKASWAKLKPSPELLSVILLAVENQKTWRQWLEGFVPHPATWLNGRRWEDEKPVAEPSKNGNGIVHKKTIAEIVAETAARYRAPKEGGE